MTDTLVGLGVLLVFHLWLMVWVCRWAQRDHRIREQAREHAARRR